MKNSSISRPFQHYSGTKRTRKVQGVNNSNVWTQKQRVTPYIQVFLLNFYIYTYSYKKQPQWSPLHFLYTCWHYIFLLFGELQLPFVKDHLAVGLWHAGDWTDLRYYRTVWYCMQKNNEKIWPNHGKDQDF